MSHLGTFDVESLGYLKKDAEPFTCISLFTGAGGAALGIRQAGFEVRVMVENEKAACDTLRRNWVERPENWREQLAAEEKIYRRKRSWFNKMYKTPHYWWQERPPAVLEVDITKTTTEEILTAGDLRIGEATMLEGGFPCQGFSAASSSRDVNDYTKDQRNFLYLECVRVIREALPKTFFLENVPGLISMERGRIIRMIVDDLSKCGYTVNWDILNAADYGVPQNRRRVFITGDRNDVMRFTKAGKTELHIGGLPGTITHPEWFLKKYPAMVQPAML